MKNVYLINLKFYNSGNVPIESSDFERLLSVDFGSNSKILSADIKDTKPQNLEIEYESSGGVLEFDPVLLNSKDSFSVKALVSDYQGVLDVDARIVGVNNIRRGPEGQRAAFIAMASGMLLTLVGVGLMAYSEPVSPEPLFESKTEVAGVVALIIGYITMGVAMTRLKKYRRLVVKMIKRMSM